MSKHNLKSEGRNTTLASVAGREASQLQALVVLAFTTQLTKTTEIRPHQTGLVAQSHLAEFHQYFYCFYSYEPFCVLHPINSKQLL